MLLSPFRFQFAILCVLILVFLIVVMIGFTHFMKQIIYPAPAIQVPELPPKPLESMFLDKKFHLWILPPVDETKPIVVWMHGNGENLETLRLSGFFSQWQRMGVRLIALEYPSYGRSPGPLNEQTMVMAVRRTVQEVRKRWSKHFLILGGWSLGTGAVMQMAVEEQPDALLLISPFTSLEELGKLQFPGVMLPLVKLALNDRYESLEAAKQIQCPVFILHGMADETIPISHGKRISAAMVGEKHLWLEGVGHNDILSLNRSWNAIEMFIKTVASEQSLDIKKEKNK